MRSPIILGFKMSQVLIIWVLLVTSTTSASSTPSSMKFLASEGFSTEDVHLSAWESNMQTTENIVHAGPAEVIPWQCFVQQKEQMCSCTIVSQDYVLARSSCINKGTTGKVQIHAGAFNSSNANQIVDASLLATSEPPPEGVVALKLGLQLSFNEHVFKISLVDNQFDVRQGIIRGFGYNYTDGEGAFESKSYRARVYQADCASGRLCVVPEDCNLSQPTNDKSTTRDFLDFYDEEDNKIYFLGVLEAQCGGNPLRYYNLKHMRQWILEYLPGVIPN